MRIALSILLSGASFFVISAPSIDPSQFTSLSGNLPTGNQAKQKDSQSNQLPSQALKNGTYTKENRNNLLLPGEVDVKLLLPSSGEDTPPPYGANLFAGGYESERIDGLNENYLIAPGDQLNIWIWGAVTYSNVMTVDNQGNIFIPEVGPIKVKGVRASAVNNYVTAQIKKTYIKNVSVYVNLLTATPVSIYLSGPVIRPGQYAGMASDSILYFLKRAGGIDSERGSYREIKVLRNNKTIQTIDLYDFIRLGVMPKVNFKDGDVILVSPQKSAVTVGGGARNPFRFELQKNASTGEQLINFARPLAKVSHVGVVGNRTTGPFSTYIPYKEFLNFKLADGDKVLFNDDQHAQVIDIQVAGSYLGPSFFTVNNQTRLHDFLQNVPIEPNLADFTNLYILRNSVAIKQKQMINDSLNRLERSVLTAPVSSSGEGSIRVQEAQLVKDFAARARKIQPLGKVIVSENGNVADILLEQGDQIVIPHKTDLVQVGGEVLLPQGVVFNPDAQVDDYIAWSGGFTERAEDHRIAIVKANGLVTFAKNVKVEKGDQILILPKVNSKVLQSVKDITQIIYQIAVAANVAVK
ncbi:MAG: polysaccharide export protein [Endozoicomonadaceae bacterium]|nr:polysaccharide export protein [Endozoicomonadaceae bacterium]